MTRRRFVLVMLMCAGCSPEMPERARVSGTVTLAGRPVTEGSILFIPVEGTIGRAGGAITDGRYTINRENGVVIGTNRVEIRVSRKSGRMVPNPMNPGTLTEEQVEAVPKEFNDASTLVRTIVRGNNTFDFDLPDR